MMIPDAPKKKYPDCYPGKVVSVADPEKMMRVQVRVFPIFEQFSDKELPWAEYLLPPGSRPGNGIFLPVKVGDWVWIDFPYAGDSRRPRIVGSMHYCPGGVPNLPADSFEGGAYPHQRTGAEPEPVAPSYHDGAIVLDENGVLIEVGADGAMRATNKASGSAIEICPDGKITVHCASEVNLSSAADTNVIVGGNATVHVAGDINANCTNANITASSSATIQAPAINLRGPISAASVSGGHGSMSMDGDLSMSGNITVQGNISASGSIIDSGGNTNHHSH